MMLFELSSSMRLIISSTIAWSVQGKGEGKVCSGEGYRKGVRGER